MLETSDLPDHLVTTVGGNCLFEQELPLVRIFLLRTSTYFATIFDLKNAECENAETDKNEVETRVKLSIPDQHESSKS